MVGGRPVCSSISPVLPGMDGLRGAHGLGKADAVVSQLVFWSFITILLEANEHAGKGS